VLKTVKNGKALLKKCISIIDICIVFSLPLTVSLVKHYRAVT